MNRLTILSTALLFPAIAFAQGAMDAYQISQPDLKGTARFMSMGGAFGALGGDLSTLSQNPAGIGVYRRSEIGFSVDLDCQSARSEAQGFSTTQDQTKFLLNNIGGVVTFNFNEASVAKNFNFGFTYSKAASFNRYYRGTIPTLSNSMSNFAAGVTNSTGATVADLQTTDKFDPYNPTDGGFAPDWLSVLGYDGFLISPEGKEDSPHWYGQFGNGTSGSGSFDMLEKGSIDQYDIALGGNIGNVVYIGMSFGITDLDYKLQSLWGENLSNAYVDGRSGVDSQWSLYNNYRVHGTGFNYKIGVIVKPIQELRLGFAVHTPTWYNLDEEFYGDINYNYPNSGINPPSGTATTNQGYTATNSYKFTAPWKFIVSAAGILGNNFIISADYEWTSYNTMRYKESSGWDYDYWDDGYYPWYYSPTRSIDMNSAYGYTNTDIQNYYRKTSTLRLGAEYRITPQFSVRAGYSYVSSPIKDEVANGDVIVETVGTRPQYSVAHNTNYITCGLGYRYQKFYIDAAFVYKRLESEFHAFTPDPATPGIPSPMAKVINNNSQIVLSMGFKF